MYDLAVGEDEMYLGDDEILGEDELLMGDDDLVLGGKAKSRGRGKVRLARIQPTQQRQALSFPQGPNGASVFTASQAGTLSARPQRVFQTERLAIPSTVAAYFYISDLVIGRDSMLVNAERMAAEIFSQTGVGVSLSGYIARPGIDVTMSAGNLDSANSRAFYGTIVGRCLV